MRHQVPGNFGVPAWRDVPAGGSRPGWTSGYFDEDAEHLRRLHAVDCAVTSTQQRYLPTSCTEVDGDIAVGIRDSDGGIDRIAAILDESHQDTVDKRLEIQDLVIPL